jgi:ribose transport system permease protein
LFAAPSLFLPWRRRLADCDIDQAGRESGEQRLGLVTHVGPALRRRLETAPQFGLLAVIAALFGLFALKQPGYISAFNLFALGRSLAVDVVIGFSQMVVLSTGGMNLSVGSIGVCGVMFSGYLLQTLGLPAPIAFLLALALAGALGWLNGFTIVKSGVNSFVVTLASANLFSGAMLILTRAEPINRLPPIVSAIGSYRVLGLVSPVLLAAIMVSVLLFIFFRYSVYGREMLATGANPRASAMSGILVDRSIVLSHTLSGLLAGMAGLMVVARVGAAVPSVGGDDWLLPSFLGPVLGGVALGGGFVSVFGTLLGAALVTVIRSGLLVLDIGNFWLQLFPGLFLFAAVLLQRYGGIFLRRAR